MEELVIIGSGPAGLTAAIYAKRSGLDPLVIVGNVQGGQLTTTTDIENFPGFKAISGTELMESMFEQAESLGVRLNYFNQVISIEYDDDAYTLYMSNGILRASSIIIATGASPKYLGLESEAKFMNNGVSACATCDGFFYKDKKVFVVGGGDTAFEEAIYLSKICEEVTLVNRTDIFRASDVMVKKVRNIENINILVNSTIEEIMGDENGVSKVSVYSSENNTTKYYDTDGVFIAIGHKPNTDFVSELLTLDEHGYIVTNENLETNMPGIFAAGDVQDSKYRQAITSAGDGCKAAIEAYNYINQ